jgi:hypothetical protein
MPNYPPKNWITKNSTTIANSDVTKFIYIGSLGLDTMYLKELAQFVISKEGKIILDIYTNQFNSEAVSYIKDLNTKHINILGSVAYDDIPFMIKNGNYQVGLIIYNGHIKNYIYNAPNKLFEYLACSLNVWYPHIMVGCQAYKNTTSFPLIFEVDFNNINTYYNQFMSISKNEIANTPSNFYYESVYTNIASVL